MRLAKSKRPSLREIPIAIIPKKGRPIAVSIKPRLANNTLLPASCPKCTGNIKFPAPKNIPNNIDPTKIYWESERVCFMINPF